MYRKGTVISDVLTPSLVTCKINDTLREVLKKLRKYRILSLPVTDNTRKFYVGRIALSDIANLLVLNPDLDILDTKISHHWPSAVGVTREDEKSLKYGPGGLESIYSFSVSTPIDVLINTFAMGVHRVLLTHRAEGHDNVIRNFSQSDLIREFYCNEDLLLKEFKQKTLDELKVIKRPALTVKMNEILGNTLKIMWENKVSAVAIIDERDQIMTTFSHSDLRELNDKLLGLINRITVGEYLLEIYTKLRPPFTISGSDTLKETITRMAIRKTHRLWEVDENTKTVKGVVSMTDIMINLSNGSSQIE